MDANVCSLPCLKKLVRTDCLKRRRFDPPLSKKSRPRDHAISCAKQRRGHADNQGYRHGRPLPYLVNAPAPCPGIHSMIERCHRAIPRYRRAPPEVVPLNATPQH